MKNSGKTAKFETGDSKHQEMLLSRAMLQTLLTKVDIAVPIEVQ
jgi:hypothetical protein